MSDEQPVPSVVWAIVEVMGHNSYGGVIEEVEQLGAKFMRVTVAETEWSRDFSVDLSASSIFRIRRCNEAVAKAHRSTTPTDCVKLRIGDPVSKQLAFAEIVDSPRPLDGFDDRDDDDDDRPF